MKSFKQHYQQLLKSGEIKVKKQLCNHCKKDISDILKNYLPYDGGVVCDDCIDYYASLWNKGVKNES